MIKAEDLAARLSMLEEHQRRMINDLNAIHGAIQECKHWLSEATKPNEPISDSTGSTAPAQG